MTIRNLLTRYQSLYKMPYECKRECARKNVHRLTQLLPLALAFGIIMVVLTFLTGEKDGSLFLVRILYYSTFILLSGIPLAIILLQKKNDKTLTFQNILCYCILTIVQYISLYQKIMSRWGEGYIVWTIATLVIIALFNIKPVFFLISTVIQFTLISIYELYYNHSQIFNLTLLFIVTIILVFTQWRQTIKEYRNVKGLKDLNAKSDDLLHNILPPRVIKDLREKGMSNPEHFDHVSIMFTDLVDFTDKSSILSPEYLIGELSDLFTSFDYITEKYGCIRIKTIGDSYMAVCGLPEPDADHSKKMVQCGIECLNYLNSRNEHSKIKWKMRVGIHSGSVVAGIVGSQKYLYDIFGDTVNIASRMETSSTEMKVNVSEETYNLTKEFFSYELREPQLVKGKGLMRMYYVRPSCNLVQDVELLE